MNVSKKYLLDLKNYKTTYVIKLVLLVKGSPKLRWC